MNNESAIEGVIFKIKRFSVHDGPGIRTTVFLKGCPLNCIWCHSPEGIDQKITIWYNPNLCIACGKCTVSCPESALTLHKDKKSFIAIDRNICNVSGNCVEACPTGAIEFTGINTNVLNIVSEIEKDLLYYQNSGGGVTLSGGEPLFQSEFSAAILKACKKRNIHTAIETSLFCETSVIDYISDNVDLFICDLKVFDPSEHKHFTGKSNDIILNNFRHIAAIGKEIVVRIPVIQNITDSESNLSNIYTFVKEVREDIKIEKIPFNPLAENNYKKLGIPFLIQ